MFVVDQEPLELFIFQSSLVILNKFDNISITGNTYMHNESMCMMFYCIMYVKVDDLPLTDI